MTIGDATLYLGSCMDVLPTLPEVAALITDPPYGIKAEFWKRVDVGRHRPIANDEKPHTEFVAPAVERVRDGGAVYLATRFDVAYPWVAAMRAAGLRMKTPIYWDKARHGCGDCTGDYGNQIEIFLFAHKGRHRLRNGRPGNLWRHTRPNGAPHPTTKPVELMERMVLSATDRGDIVLDPFMGSGSTGVAAIQSGRKFIGVELDPEYFELSCERIRAAHTQRRLHAVR